VEKSSFQESLLEAEFDENRFLFFLWIDPEANSNIGGLYQR